MQERLDVRGELRELPPQGSQGFVGGEKLSVGESDPPAGMTAGISAQPLDVAGTLRPRRPPAPDYRLRQHHQQTPPRQSPKPWTFTEFGTNRRTKSAAFMPSISP